MKRLIILCLLLLSGCSGGGFESVSQVIPEGKPAEKEIMDAHVKIYSVAGSTDGVVFLADQRDKWIVTEASVFRDHPKTLVLTSEGQQVEGELQAFNIEKNIAIVHIRNSAETKAIEQEDQQFLEDMLKSDKLTSEDRYRLHEAFKVGDAPKKYDMTVLEDYEKSTFTYNPDAIEHFILTFNTAFNQYVKNGDFSLIETYILPDLLKDALQKEEARLLIEDMKITEIGQSGFEWVVKGETASYAITYKVNRVNGRFYVTSIFIDK